MTRVALVTCSLLPNLEPDDQLLVRALRDCGMQTDVAIWDDPRVAWASFDAAIVRTTWDYPVRRDEFVAWANATSVKTTLWNPAPLITWNTDKWYLERFAREGLATISTRFFRRGDSFVAPEVIASLSSANLVLKPMVSAGSRGIVRTSNEEELNASLSSMLRRGDVMVQPYLPAIETRGELSLLYFDGVFSHAVRKLPKSGDFRVQSQYGATHSVDSPSDLERELASDVLRVVGEIPLYARVDLVVEKGAPKLIEIELVEPILFFGLSDEAAHRMAEAVGMRLTHR